MPTASCKPAGGDVRFSGALNSNGSFSTEHRRASGDEIEVACYSDPVQSARRSRSDRGRTLAWVVPRELVTAAILSSYARQEQKSTGRNIWTPLRTHRVETGLDGAAAASTSQPEAARYARVDEDLDQPGGYLEKQMFDLRPGVG